MMVMLVSFVLSISLISGSGAVGPRHAPPLPAPQGEVIHVATVEELLGAVDRVGPGSTILLADGHYKLPRVIVLREKKDITIRSAAGDPAKVILSGRGWDSNARGDDILHVARCQRVTIADLTFTDCRSYGIKVEAENAPRDVHIYNCRFRDIGVRAIKGSAGQDPNVRAVKGSVRYCQFENTKVPPADWLYGGDYIAAIDMMALEDWTFSDNVFRDIKGRNGGGRAAVFIWVRSRRVVVERNLIVNCDRGIAFGNPGQSTANLAGERLVYVSDGIIRNNFVAGGPDCGIELWYADGVKVYNNSVWRPELNWARGIRVGTGTAHADIANNLVHGEIRLEDGEAQLRQNLTGRLDDYFVDPVSGNLALTPAAIKAIDQSVPLPEVTDDIGGRPRRGVPDLGAWELDDAGAEDNPPCTTYGSLADLMAAQNARYPELVRISDPGTREKPNYTGFFFYQCLQFDPTDRYALGMRVRVRNRDVRPTDRGEIGLIDLQDGCKWIQIGETTAWNWQQGPRLQWRPGSDEILWNDRSDDGTGYVCRVYNFKTGARRVLPRPIYTPSPDGSVALTHDFERMKHGGTPYVGIEDKYADQHAPRETGIWRMDLNTGDTSLIMTLDKMAEIAYPKGRPSSGCLYIFREGWNSSGSRFIAFLKDPENKLDKAFSMTANGTDVRYLYNLPSHHEWRDDDHILDGRGYYLYEDDGTGKAKDRLFDSNQNGHVTYIPGPGGDWIISDTYAIDGYQHLFMYHIPTKRFVPLGTLKSTAPTGIYRVDLHPRLSRSGRMISIDATHEGLGRQMYVLNIGPILDNPPDAAVTPGKAPAKEDAVPIRLHPGNPHYFLFRGRPAVLITAGEHYGAVMNLDFDYVRYLDVLRDCGFNLTRTFCGTYREVPGSFGITGNTLAPAAGRFVCPWARSETPGASDGGNKFDLTKWDATYFERLRDFIIQAGRRGVVVELVLFCTMYDDKLWDASPMNVRNNVNGIGGVGRSEVYDARDKDLLAAQQAVVRKLGVELNEFDNLYYEVCNEPYERGGLTGEWNDRIVAAIVGTEASLPKKHLIAQGFPPIPSAIAGLNPHVSILNFHAAKPDAVRLNFHLNKVVAFDETGGSDRSDRKYRTEGWDFILAGGGVYDHLDLSFTPDREDGTAVPLPPGTPGGGSPELRKQLRILKEFIEGFDFVRMAPANETIKESRITGSPPAAAKATVRVLAELGKRYAVYVNGGNQAELELDLPAGVYKAEWVNTKTGGIDKTETFTHAAGHRTLLSPAYSEDIALRVLRQGNGK